MQDNVKRSLHIMCDACTPNKNVEVKSNAFRSQTYSSHYVKEYPVCTIDMESPSA